MPSVDISSTLFTNKTQGTQGAPPDALNKYGGAVIFVILVLAVNILYIHSVVNTAIDVERRFLRVMLVTHLYMFTILAVWSYFRTHCAPVPKIPERFSFTAAEWQLLESRNFMLETLAEELKCMAEARGVRTRTFEGAVNCCLTCRLIKPERTHHCSTCQTCVVKMDHHCPWFGNCIHFDNFKFFLLALFYSVLGMAFVIITCSAYLLRSEKAVTAIKNDSGAMVSFVVLSLLAIVIGVAVGGFFLTSFYHALHNVTTLEDLKGTVCFADGVEESYNLGSYSLNLKQQFGPVVFAWLVPIKSTAQDGTLFLVRSDVEKQKITVANKQKDNFHVG